METMINLDFIKKHPVSYSRLKEFRKSPKHYVMSWERPFVESDAMIIGSATDCLLIEGEEEFNRKFLPYQKFDKRSNAAKDEWAALIYKAKAEKKTLISNELIETAQACANAVRIYPDAQPYLQMRKKHLRMEWTDRETGIPCVAIPDWDCMLDNQLCVVDLKASNNADPEDFAKNAWNYEYFIQVGAYLDAYKNIQFQFPLFVFIVVETDELHNVSINFVENKYIEFCKEEWKGTLKAFKYCLDNNLWHMGYEFRLMDTATYFALRKPGWGKALFGSWDNK